ncbi:ArpU family phage packaging/lysis transcriptional regulator [Lactobacillus crispatus]|uniref:hypothetical protein n=1 Tax=Lactobacillus crispatus TaxID=47770 RepID=UPI001E627D40|nr:hypothetical protein [Lactobacillus crispatus]
MKEETRDVNLFLKKDFWHYLNLGGINYNQLSSPQLTFTPNTHSYTNGTEKRLIDDMSEAERSTYIATTIIIAFKDCTDIEGRRHKSILEDYYIKELTNQAVAIRYNLSDWQYKKAKRNALIEFAERFNFWRLKHDCPELPVLTYAETKRKPNNK